MKKKLYHLHFAFCVNDSYARYISVPIKSILENHRDRDISIHVLTDYICWNNRKILNEIIRNYNRTTLYIYEIDDTDLRDLEAGHWTKYAWYRILIPNILPKDIKKVLYLDADTLVVSDLSSVFSIDMGEKSIAAVEDIYSNSKETYNRLGYDSSKKYICTGVMLMNLDFWRKNLLPAKIVSWAKYNSDSIVAADQDAINYICRESKILLPLRFDIFNAFLLSDAYLQMPYLNQVKDCITNPAIIHYSGYAPWIKDRPQHLLYDEWIKYNKMLRHPVKLIYRAKGFLLLKLYLWDILHPFKDRYASWKKRHKQEILNR